VSEEVAKMRVTLARIERERGEAQSDEQHYCCALEALKSTLKRKRSQINDLKFVQSLSLED
jgi:hypothetical protein